MASTEKGKPHNAKHSEWNKVFLCGKTKAETMKTPSGTSSNSHHHLHHHHNHHQKERSFKPSETEEERKKR
jgi:hypothetical protein